MASILRRVKNEIQNLADSSDRKVAPTKSYIVVVTASSVTTSIAKVVEKFLVKEDSDFDLVYCYRNTVHILFTCRDKHEFDGSHHHLCSHYASGITLLLKKSVLCHLVELETKTQVFSYLMWHMHENTQKSIMELSDAITCRSTQSEMISQLADEGIIWDEIDKDKKYGFFLQAYDGKEYAEIRHINMILDFTKMAEQIDLLFGQKG